MARHRVGNSYLSDEELSEHQSENWKITLIDTGPETMTGGRIKKIIPYVNNETFLLTYGDGFADINISDLITFHYQNKKLATVTAVRPPGRFGVLSLKTDSSYFSNLDIFLIYFHQYQH